MNKAWIGHRNWLGYFRYWYYKKRGWVFSRDYYVKPNKWRYLKKLMQITRSKS